LDVVSGATRDTAVLTRAAVLYFSRGRELVAIRQLIPTAVDMLEKALADDVRGVLREQANFYLAFAILLRVYEVDPQVMESKSCAMVDQEADLIRRGLEAAQIGINVHPSAQQFRDNLQNMRDRIPALKQSFSCP